MKRVAKGYYIAAVLLLLWAAADVYHYAAIGRELVSYYDGSGVLQQLVHHSLFQGAVKALLGGLILFLGWRRGRKGAPVSSLTAVTALLADVEGDEKTGVQIVAKALEEPIRQIAANAGLDGSVILEKVRTSGKNGYGFDAYKEEYCDMIASGIVDPAKVTRSALENAASVSGMVLTTESLVADKPQPAAPAAPAPDMGGMGGMY